MNIHWSIMLSLYVMPLSILWYTTYVLRSHISGFLGSYGSLAFLRICIGVIHQAQYTSSGTAPALFDGIFAQLYPTILCLELITPRVADNEYIFSRNNEVFSDSRITQPIYSIAAVLGMAIITIMWFPLPNISHIRFYAVISALLLCSGLYTHIAFRHSRKTIFHFDISGWIWARIGFLLMASSTFFEYLVFAFQLYTPYNYLYWFGLAHAPFIFALQTVNWSLITRKNRHIAAVQSLVLIDSLTNAYNRRAFNEHMKSLKREIYKKNQHFALIYIDIDKFKTINDSLNHITGDNVLRIFSQRIMRLLRKEDKLFRLGGDEFVTYISIRSEKPQHMLESVTKRIIAETCSRPYSFNGKKLHISCSMGVALYPSDKIPLDKLVESADNSMMVAKKQPSSSVVFHRNRK